MQKWDALSVKLHILNVKLWWKVKHMTMHMGVTRFVLYRTLDLILLLKDLLLNSGKMFLLLFV